MQSGQTSSRRLWRRSDLGRRSSASGGPVDLQFEVGQVGGVTAAMEICALVFQQAVQVEMDELDLEPV